MGGPSQTSIVVFHGAHILMLTACTFHVAVDVGAAMAVPAFTLMAVAAFAVMAIAPVMLMFRAFVAACVMAAVRRPGGKRGRGH